MPSLIFSPDTTREVEQVVSDHLDQETRLYLIFGVDGRASVAPAIEGYVVAQAATNHAALLQSRRSVMSYKLDTDRIVLIREAKTGAELYRHPSYASSHDWKDAAIAFNTQGSDLWELWARRNHEELVRVRRLARDESGRELVLSLATRPQLSRYLDKRLRFDL